MRPYLVPRVHNNREADSAKEAEQDARHGHANRERHWEYGPVFICFVF